MVNENLDNFEAKDEPMSLVDEDETKDVMDKAELDDPSRWSYFIVEKIDQEFMSKMDVKKWLQENGVNNNQVIRGRVLPINEKIKRIVTIG
jgi:hypothetical protein